MMVFDQSQVEELKQQYTDKYVVVDADRPELARFRDVVGVVKTVNMSGRALVEFGDYFLNIGWYDIDPSFLKVVDKPAPKPKEPPAKKAAGEVASVAGKAAAAGKAAPKPSPAKSAAAPGEKKPSPLELARAQGAVGKGSAAAPKPSAGKPSTADILAAARGKVDKTVNAAAESGNQPAAPAPPAAKVDRSKMSVADMLAAARAGGTPAAAPAKPAEAEAEPAGEPASAGGAEPAPAKQPSGEKIDKKSMTIDQIIAWCREHDAK